MTEIFHFYSSALFFLPLFMLSLPLFFSQQHLAAAQQAVQPIQAAQPAPAPAMQPVQPQYDYSAYAGMARWL